MNVSISINSPKTQTISVINRPDIQLVVGEGTVDIDMSELTIVQATEVITRLRGMPGIPELSTGDTPLTALLSAFPRKIDL